MKSDIFTHQWRLPLVFCLTLMGLGLLLGLNPSPSRADEVIDSAEPAATSVYENDSQENYQDMNKDNYQNTSDYDYQDENKLKSKNDNQEDY
jgi:hypothetical protein